jgi:hypothetical protein
VEIVAGHGKNLRPTIGWRHLGMIPEAVGHNYSGTTKLASHASRSPVPFVYRKGNFVWSILLTP